MAKKGGAKEVTSVFKIQAPGGSATPAPPIGPALGQHGVNPGQFIQQFNDATRHLNGKVVGCVITVFGDRSFTFEIKSPPAAVLILDALNIKSVRWVWRPNWKWRKPAAPCVSMFVNRS